MSLKDCEINRILLVEIPTEEIAKLVILVTL